MCLNYFISTSVEFAYNIQVDGEVCNYTSQNDAFPSKLIKLTLVTEFASTKLISNGELLQS